MMIRFFCHTIANARKLMRALLGKFECQLFEFGFIDDHYLPPNNKSIHDRTPMPNRSPIMNKPKHFRFRIISGSLIGNPYRSEFCGVRMFAVPRRAKFRNNGILRHQSARVVMDRERVIALSQDRINGTLILEQ